MISILKSLYGSLKEENFSEFKYIFLIILTILLSTQSLNGVWNEFNYYKQYYPWLNMKIYSHVQINCNKYKVPIPEVLALIQSESWGTVRAKSHVNARGLMQVMPIHTKHKDKDILYNVSLNIKLGVSYYAYCLKLAKGNRRMALQKYNAGPSSNPKHYKNWKAYVDVIEYNSNRVKVAKINKYFIVK